MEGEEISGAIDNTGSEHNSIRRIDATARGNDAPEENGEDAERESQQRPKTKPKKKKKKKNPRTETRKEGARSYGSRQRNQRANEDKTHAIPIRDRTEVLAQWTRRV
jgi:hypothetical protein